MTKGSFIQRWLFRFLLAATIAIGIGYLPFGAFGPEGVARALRLEGDLKHLEESNHKLKLDNRLLRDQIKGLQGDRATIERVARDELGLIRAEDTVYQFE